MIVTFFGAAQPRDPVHHWLKPDAKADVAHYVIWQRGHELRADCHYQMDARQATSARSGVRLCEVCLSNLRSRMRHARKQKARR